MKDKQKIYQSNMPALPQLQKICVETAHTEADTNGSAIGKSLSKTEKKNMIQKLIGHLQESN